VQHSEHNLFDFLAERRDRLDGVVFSGGECTACCELPELCAPVKDAGFKVKLDTNGTYPHTLATMIAGGLVDYIALDYKAPYYKFEQVTGSRLFSQFSQSLDLLIDSNLDFEVRTTFHSALLDSADIHGIASDLQQRGYTGTLYIQNFVNGTKTLGSPGESRRLLPAELSDFPVKVELRE
jgi:pyruvate formate lyase activating enzyme